MTGTQSETQVDNSPSGAAEGEDLFGRTAKILDRNTRLSASRQKQITKAERELQELLRQKTEDDLDVEHGTLPMFPEMTSGMPHKWARTSLFCSVMHGDRPVHNQVKLTSRSDFNIVYTGEQLGMADNDVFLHVVKLAENQSTRGKIHFVRSRFLRDINRTPGNSGYLWLESSLRRLASATIFIEDSRGRGGVFRLIKDLIWNKETDEYWFSLDPNLPSFFEISKIAFINLESRRRYKYPFSKWLQNYVSSHRANDWHMISVENIMLWAGITGRERDFVSKETRGLRRALNELVTGDDIRHDWSIYTRIKNGEKVNMVKWFRLPRKSDDDKISADRSPVLIEGTAEHEDNPIAEALKELLGAND